MTIHDLKDKYKKSCEENSKLQRTVFRLKTELKRSHKNYELLRRLHDKLKGVHSKLLEYLANVHMTQNGENELINIHRLLSEPHTVELGFILGEGLGYSEFNLIHKLWNEFNIKCESGLELVEDGTIEEWANSHVKRKEIYDIRIDKCWEKYGPYVDNMLDKIIEKYESDKYKDRERKAGREPREHLYDFFLDYARKYGGKYDDGLEQMFAYESYILGNYTVTLFMGQGSFIRVNKN